MTTSEADDANRHSPVSASRNCRAPSWWPLFNALPEKIRLLSDETFKVFKENPEHPSLVNHPLDDTRRGRHHKGSRAVCITMKYRAIYVIDGDTNVWYWIGSHNDYENFTGRK